MTQLDDEMARAVKSGIPGLSVALANQQGLIWTGTAGMANIQTQTPVAPDHLFGIGSITKTFVAVVILQLVEEGLLSLEQTPLSILGDQVVGAVPNAGSATIAQLLNHSSGIPSWEDDPRWIREGRGAALDTDRLWRPRDTLAYIEGSEPLGAPGEHYAYANTNHSILGLVIESVTGQRLTTQICQRILQPLGLRDIYLEGFQPLPQQRLASRYHYCTAEFVRDAGVQKNFTKVGSELIDVSPSNLSVEWAAGGMVATARDLAMYAAAFRAGRLLSPASMAFIQQWRPINQRSQIGHGLFYNQTAGGQSMLGHMGAVLGYTAAMHWLEDSDLAIAVVANVGTMHIGQNLPNAATIAMDDNFIQQARAVACGD